jgi:hypothetical protein
MIGDMIAVMIEIVGMIVIDTIVETIMTGGMIAAPAVTTEIAATTIDVMIGKTITIDMMIGIGVTIGIHAMIDGVSR